MHTLWNAADCRSLVERLHRLTPDAEARWGRLDARGVLAHLHDAARMALGDMVVSPKRLPIRYPPLKQFIIYVMPFPRSAPTAPELVARRADDWNAELAALEGALARLASKGPADRWLDHPAFGSMTHKAWGVLIYRHTDHHLRQFGV